MKIREDGENMFCINRLFCKIFLNRFKRKKFRRLFLISKWSQLFYLLLTKNILKIWNTLNSTFVCLFYLFVSMVQNSLRRGIKIFFRNQYRCFRICPQIYQKNFSKTWPITLKLNENLTRKFLSNYHLE